MKTSVNGAPMAQIQLTVLEQSAADGRSERDVRRGARRRQVAAEQRAIETRLEAIDEGISERSTKSGALLGSIAHFGINGFLATFVPGLLLAGGGSGAVAGAKEVFRAAVGSTLGSPVNIAMNLGLGAGIGTELGIVASASARSAQVRLARDAGLLENRAQAWAKQADDSSDEIAAGEAREDRLARLLDEMRASKRA